MPEFASLELAEQVSAGPVLVEPVLVEQVSAGQVLAELVLVGQVLAQPELANSLLAARAIRRKESQSAERVALRRCQANSSWPDLEPPVR